MPIVGLLPGVGRLVINGEMQGCMAMSFWVVQIGEFQI